MNAPSIEDYYATQASLYRDQTLNVDPEPFLGPLAQQLKKRATVLDIGCGAGRDLRWLKERGFQPIGLERSAPLAAHARQHSGCPVIEADFTTSTFPAPRFDAILLVGALVHLPPTELTPVLARLLAAVRAGGLVLLTLKEGTGSTRHADGRVFHLWERNGLETRFAALGCTVLSFFRNRSAIRPEEIWLGYVLQPEGEGQHVRLLDRPVA